MFPPILPPFPQTPPTLTARQIECIRCRETFTIAEDVPLRHGPRTGAWQVPHDQYPKSDARFEPDREQVGIMPEIRAEPTGQISASRLWDRNYHINCPRCGADNRNWLFISGNIRPFASAYVLLGALISVLLATYVIFSLWDTFFSDRAMAVVLLLLAAILPFQFIPGQWRALREHQLANRFLPQVSRPSLSPPMQTALFIYMVLILLLPGIRYGLFPVGGYLFETIIVLEDEPVDVDQAKESLNDDLGFLGQWLYRGTLVSLVASAFALFGVSEVMARANRQLPHPIYANAANMVRVTLWEVRRALEIKVYFDRIQWMMTQRNEAGGIDLEGLFRDPPEFLPNGRLDNMVRVQKYLISTDRWCRITSARIVDTTGLRPAGGVYNEPLPQKAFAGQAVVVDRQRQ